MTYLLVWSFAVNTIWISGSANFPTMDMCKEAEGILRGYSVTPKDAYIRCTPMECDNNKEFDKAMLLLTAKRMEHIKREVMADVKPQ